MAQVTLDQAIKLLSSDKLKERTDGLGDLKHILQQNRKNPTLNELEDKARHKIFDALFRFVSIEKSAASRPTKSGSSSRPGSASRLSTCASVFRIAVEALLHNLRTKTVHAIIDHVIQMMQEPEDLLWECLSNDYIKSLRTLFEYPPHIEHLGKDDWLDVMDFCLQSIGHKNSDGSQESAQSSNYLSGSVEAGISHSTTIRTIKGHAPKIGQLESNKGVIKEAIGCIQLLTACTNAPIQEAAKKVLNGLSEYLLSCQQPADSHLTAFKSINAILTRVIYDQSDVVRDFILEVMPLIRRLWVSKFPELKDEILATITLGMSLIVKDSRTLPTQPMAESVEGLVDVLLSEYMKRPEREILQVDDLVYRQSDSHNFEIPIFGPRLGNYRSEHSWTVIWAIASLLAVLDDMAARSLVPSAADESPNKRPRLLSRIDDIIRDSFSSSGTRKACALQLIPFFRDRLSVEIKGSLLERLTMNIPDDSAYLSSWTMIAIASIASDKGAKSHPLKPYWRQTWDLASRASVTQATSRAACYLMCIILHSRLLDHSETAETIRSMLLSVDLNGPSMFCDSSLTLWATAIKMHIRPGLGLDATKQVCNWLRGVWTIGTFTDKIQAAHVAVFARPFNILDLLLTCTNRSTSRFGVTYQGPASSISRAWSFKYRNRSLTDYLFSVDEPRGFSDLWNLQEVVFSLGSSFRNDPNDTVVVELLQAKTDSFYQAWRALSGEKSHHITEDIIQILASLCIVAAIFVECLPQPHGLRAQELRKSIKCLWEEMCEFLSSKEGNFVQAYLEVLSSLSFAAPCLNDPSDALSRALDNLVTPLINILEGHALKRDPFFMDVESMDLDDQPSFHNDLAMRNSIVINSRESLPVFADNASFIRCMTIRLSIFRYGMAQSGEVEASQGLLVDYLETLDEVDILSAQTFLPKVFKECSKMARTKVLNIIVYFGETCLQSYQLERCENSLCLCIKLITSFVGLWTAGNDDNLDDSASDVYAWFIDVLLSKARPSSKVLIALAELLSRVLESNPSHSMDQLTQSSRTSFFKILEIGDMLVKFNVAKFVPLLFRRFVLNNHDAIFDDVLNSLPRDPDWSEGIALRLYVLAQLASCWHTLLRRSIYHIFETPGRVPNSALYAKKCLLDVSKSLGLNDAREIFQLFSSQILYTWTETQSIVSMPFHIFGYPSLKYMLRDAQDEIVGQIMMRANDREASKLSACLGHPFSNLLAKSLYKAEAYCIARDISIPPSQDNQPKGVENRVKTQLGPDLFVNLVEQDFPLIVATLFRALDQEEQIEKAFAKRPKFQFALENLQTIISKSSSSPLSVASQQPSFRARYLIDELEFLCKRTGHDLETMWTPALVSFVSRILLESIHPALGSLHARSVLRKLRILMCIAGSVILSDYQLESLLHALRPFLTDFHCSEDSLGMFWYLLELGKHYLLEHPGFVAGIAVSTFVSMQGFLNSPPESTTQRTQFKSLLSKIRKFLGWFSDFLEDYRPSGVGQETELSLRKIILSSRKVGSVGNAIKGTYESDLLLELLQDRASGRNLLKCSISDLALSLLCAEFQKPSDFRDDILGNDKAAVNNAVSVWQTIQNGSPGFEYRLWAARVIGRAYAATGQISDVLIREQNPELFKNNSEIQGSNPYFKSKVCILDMLCDMLLSSNRLEVGLIERTLQLIVSELANYPDLEQCQQALPPSLMKTLIWNPYRCPNIPLLCSDDPEREIILESGVSASEWARNIALFLALAVKDDPIIGPLQKIIYTVPEAAVRLLPFVLHDVLLSQSEGEQRCRQDISNVFDKALRDVEEATIPHVQLVVNCILYLRNQQKPHEMTIAERDDWLDIDYGQAASAALQCRMYKTSLLFVEIQASRVASVGRRSFVSRYNPPADLLHDIFKNIGDPDLFYGIEQDTSLESVMEKLDHESAGFRNLLFQSAQYDSDIKTTGKPNTYGIIKALNSTNLQGVASAMFSSSDSGGGMAPLDCLLSNAMSLQQWDIPVPATHQSATGILFRAFQNLNMSRDKAEIISSLDNCFVEVLNGINKKTRSVTTMRDSMRALGILSEIDESICSISPAQIEEEWVRIMCRKAWLQTESFQDISQILFSREALFSSLNCRDCLKLSMNLTSREAQLLYAKVLRESLRVSRGHEDSQGSLRSAISLLKLVEPSAMLGIIVDAAARFDLANVLWDQGEMTASIRILQQLSNQNDLHKQAISVSRAEVLASLGHHVAEARLEKPEAIIREYLIPAVKELKGNSDTEESGRVLHTFAAFCDQQLQNPDGLEDFRRIEQLRKRKEEEVLALEKMLQSAGGKEKESLNQHRAKAKQWFDLDDREYQRLKRSREAFLEQCLENYLLCLKACDAYNNDALRFCALWLDESDSQRANNAVGRHIDQVPSRKFAPLMNQLSSRLLDIPSDFQSMLYKLIFRICVEHPYHGMYQIFSSVKSKSGRDQTSRARVNAVDKLANDLKGDNRVGTTWVSIHNMNVTYVKFAAQRLDDKFKSGTKVALKSLPFGERLEQEATNSMLPPATMRVELRVDCDYSCLPKIVKFHSELTIASGVSAPKIVTAVASDGSRYKQLVKGGNDDLRQDAIMEQVFEQVSNLLKDNRATRQRNLGIRTYKVLPLTSNAGIIEFVQNTIPLHDYLMPAHQRYFPKDMRPNTCRRNVADAQTRSIEHRVRTFRQVTEHFRPVMRYFFMEKFNNPDDWFGKRLVYTRSTAAISILGHVLGLGDRHGHNILLDEKTGEVVHIDLGVAFEQGRILPVPEVVPFRLTRDLVDGMGITKTEGVFRRCCEFTLEALRQESYSIMTILDVLRYDPLYSWTLSPLRMKKIQEDQAAGDVPPVPDNATGRSSINEPSEADRALTVVMKKLSKTLSVTATVNELIQQATDERHLALLFCGWAAYA